MKVVAVLTDLPSAGGGFHQSLNVILQMQRLCAGRHDFEVVCTDAENLATLQSFGLKARCRPIKLMDRVFALLYGNVFWRTLNSRLKTRPPFERALLGMGCDLACFCSPSWLPMTLQTLNFITTLWDVCHLEHPEFPEVRDFSTLATRERVYLAVLQAAVLVVVDSARLAELATFHYRLAPSRVVVMPFAPSPQLASEPDADHAERSGTNIQDPAFLYPANLWAHKNHIRILQALIVLQGQGWRPRVVFCGQDKGNLAYLSRFTAQHGLGEQVQFVGLVEPGHLKSLYRSALAVVMPTYFGQTNLPPLEAWAMGVPLIYSATLAAQAGNAALLVDPDDAEDLARAMWSCRDAEVRERLRAAGQERLACLAEERSRAEQALAAQLDAFSARRDCWD